MSYQLLFNELARYPGASDEEIAAALSVVTVVSKLAKTSEIIALAYNIGLYPQLVAISDDEFKAYLKEHLDELEALLTELARFYLNAGQGHTIEDIANLIEWAKREFGLEYN